VDELVTPGGLRTDPTSVSWTSSRSGGPGGQHANTSDSAVTITVEVAATGCPAHVRERVAAVLGPVVTARSADSRSQWRNRQLAWERLADRIDRAARPPRSRRATRPTRGSVRARLDDKRHRSDVKRARRRPGARDVDGP
jgi:ribosome-associated protein